jgi:hypothetical protein
MVRKTGGGFALFFLVALVVSFLGYDCGMRGVALAQGQPIIYPAKGTDRL